MGKRNLVLGLWCLANLVAPAQAQVQTQVPPVVAGAKAVSVQRIKVHAPSLEGNLEGDSADRDVVVVLPPDYAASPRKRYPVLYALHGYSIGVEQWIKEIHVPQVIEGGFALGTQPMIIVLPDSKTLHNGSMYSSSPTTGDFENFIARDLVAYVDAQYRTLPHRESRGLVGHSMGGYGASRIGMKHADVFGAVYMMSPCCLSARDASMLDAAAVRQLESIPSREAATTLPWALRATLAAAAAWSPDPKAPPLYLALPIRDGKQQPEVLAKWAANAPLAFVDQYIGALRRYRAIAIDVGDKDGLRVDAEKLHAVLDQYGVANSFTVYTGDHTSAVADRFQNYVLPFFSKNLIFANKR